MPSHLSLSRAAQSRENRITRKQFLQYAGGAVASGALGWPSVTFGSETDWSQRERIARVLREYDSQGDHRTGSAVDAESGRWLADQLSELGAESALERMPFNRIDIQASYVEADGRSVQGIPIFDGRFTDSDGVSGSLGAVGTSAEIGVVRLSPFQGPELANYRRTLSDIR